MRGSDRVFAVRLFALAAATVGLAALLALFGLLPPWMGPIEGLLAGVGLGGAVVLVLAAQTRQRAQTREGKRIFLTTVVIWVVWAEVVQEFSFRSDWMFHGLPQVVRGGHLVVSALIAVVPLLIGALMLGRRR